MTLIRHHLVLLVCVLTIALGATVAADDGRLTLTPLDLARMQNMNSARISPDGSLIAAVRSVPRTLFDQEDGPNWAELYRVTTAGGQRKPLERFAGGVVYTSMSVADDGRHVALIGNSYSHPGEVFALDLADELPPARLTEANPWLAGIRLAPQEVVLHEARDGLELEGILIRPLDGSPDRPAPLVMVMHGGPEGHRRNGWPSRYSAPAQVLAARGYAVFFPNYRGSTGRGVEFSKLGQADAAGAELPSYRLDYRSPEHGRESTVEE